MPPSMAVCTITRFILLFILQAKVLEDIEGASRPSVIKYHPSTVPDDPFSESSKLLPPPLGGLVLTVSEVGRHHIRFYSLCWLQCINHVTFAARYQVQWQPA